jgi:hypothetical protein
MATTPEIVSVSTYVDPYSSNHTVGQRDDLKHEQIA